MNQSTVSRFVDEIRLPWLRPKSRGDETIKRMYWGEIILAWYKTRQEKWILGE